MKKIQIILIALIFLLPIQGNSQRKRDKQKDNAKTENVLLNAFKLRNVGPALLSGRIADIAIHPNDESTWYIAVGSGGVWKTQNAGTTWNPIFDSQPTYSIGSITIDPSNTNTIWVGSGENVGGRHVGYGDGVYKSTDGASHSDITGLKQLSTHTIAPTYKLNLGKTSISLNGNITILNDLDLLTDTTGCFEILNSTKGIEWEGDSTKCEGDNDFYFTETNNPLRDSGTYTSTYTSALSFSFPSPLSLNLGWGMSVNSPNDRRQSKTVISVFSTKLGYKFLDKKLNVTIGGNYVIGHKSGNEFWDSGEEFTADWNNNESFDLRSYDEYDDLDGDDIWSDGDTLKVDFNENNAYDVYEADTFIDKVELNNTKLTLKCGMQYKIPEPNITIGLNLNYTKAVDYLKTEQDDPVFKAKLAIKFGF